MQTVRVNIPRINGATAGLLAIVTSACCPTVAGPTVPAASYTITLQAGEVRHFDADTPATTTQINLTFRFSATGDTVRLRQIDPACLPGPGDSCQTFADTTFAPRPAGVLQFGTTLQPRGDRTRVVLQNPSSDAPVTVTLTIEPWRAGCT